MAGSNLPGYRKIGNDGQVDIYCRICENFISRQLYKGFSTAICHYCANGTPRPLEEEPNPAVIALYNEMEVERQGLTGFVFKVIGFAKRKVKDLVSEKVATAKKRKPIFSKPGVEKPKT